jgi:LmbE family N-acetylglucosaminyl deacetylase
MNFSTRRILFLGGHPDDIELGCGAFLHKIAGYSEVRCITLSDNSRNPELKNIVSEHLASLKTLGVLAELADGGQLPTRFSMCVTIFEPLPPIF